MERERSTWLESLTTLILTGVYLWITFDREDKANGGPGAAMRLRAKRDSLLKPWHYPERWRRMKNEVIVEAWVAVDDQPPGLK